MSGKCFLSTLVWLGVALMPCFAQTDPPILFVDELDGSGLDFVNVSGERDKRLILSTLGSGVAVFDYDEDSDLDLYFVNGARIDASGAVTGASNRLYRNEGDWRFIDVTEAAGVGDDGWGMGVSSSDIDGDGDRDLFVTNVGANRLFLNRGDGTFAEVAAEAGLTHSGWGTSSVFFDADSDADLDLYVTNYITPDLESIPPAGKEARCQWFGLNIMCGPNGLPAESDVYFENQGNGQWIDKTELAGFAGAHPSYGLGVVAGDFDSDGDSDLYVANDSVPNFLFRNDGAGRFEEVAFLAGVALSTDGLEQAGMGVDFGDLNGDGRFDLYVTNFSHETNNAYVNHGDGLFVDIAGESNMHARSWFSLGWGTRFVDFDNDRDLDIFVANGHVYPGVDESNLKTEYRQRNQIFWNDGLGGYEERSYAPSDALAISQASRAAAFGDVDRDGDMDGVVVNIDDSPSLLRNNQAEGTFLRLRLVARGSPREGGGARVVAKNGGSTQTAELHTAGSFLSSSEPVVHFGLGEADSVETITVRWPSGDEETLEDVASGQFLVWLEGSGIVKSSKQ